MTIWNSIKLAILALSGLAETGALAETQQSKEPDRTATAKTGALAGHRYRVLISTDIGGTDPDDLRMGDTPSVAYLLHGTPDDPSQPSWGGTFTRIWSGRKTIFERLTTEADQVEVFGVVEFALPVPEGMIGRHTARMVFENRIPAMATNDGNVLRFRFSPRDAKVWSYGLRSDFAGLDGRSGKFTAVPPGADRTNRPSSRHPNWWIDDPDPAAAEGIHPGAKSVNRWREDFLRNFAARMLRCQSPASPNPGPKPEVAALKPAAFAPHIERFNAMEDENVTNVVSNAVSWDWLRANIPFFECPDAQVEEIYYFRWWSFRKHLKQTPQGFVFTEFLTPVRHAGEFNTISCAAGHHLAEGRWLRDQRYLDDYTLFWLRGNDGRPQPHFHQFSSWFAAAAYERFLVNHDQRFLVALLDDLVADYRAWEEERQLPNGLFWQYDVRDGMEESISGGRRQKNIRPTINSYMFANARALAAIAALAKKPTLATEFTSKAEELRRLTQSSLWDREAKFFKVRLDNGQLSHAREEIGFVPWMFGLPEGGQGYEAAWMQLIDPQGFRAPFGITTAERRHPQFRSHGVGTCEWDGAVWPFATSQTLHALAHVLRDYKQPDVTLRDYFDAFLAYVRSQHAGGKPYIGEYLDEVTGDWINRGDRSRYYNHSTFADLLITGVVGLRPHATDTVEVHPLLPDGTWDWFCLDGVKYHDHMITILWDKDGSRYGRGKGLRVLAGGKEIAHSSELKRTTGKLP